MTAALGGNSEILEILLSHGASVNSKDTKGNLAIHYAVHNGHLECVKILIEKGSLANVGNAKFRNPLMIAAEQGHVEIVNYLLDRGVNMSYQMNTFCESELIVAVDENHLDVVKVLLDRANPHIDRKEELNVAYADALAFCESEMIQALLAAGADVNYTEENHDPPLIRAIRQKKLDVVKILSSYGVDLNVRTVSGHTALTYAITSELNDIAEYLIKAGADISATVRETELTALDLAKADGNDRIVQALKCAQR